MSTDLKRRVAGIASMVAVVALGVSAILVAPSFRNPKFRIVNETAEVVSVVASWKDQNEMIEAIGP